MEILRKNQKVMAKIKNITEMKNIFNVLINKLIAEERSFELECISIESLKTEMQREQRLRKQSIISKDCRTTIIV